ncbi:SPOR domain-containing protein [Kordiimonas laminariae]|uniref:SPOR domain-containing protein n=1 Tax=Kordiimonas laminariae TaxID=2917717 RepID=UPI001FF6283E|nr:SPOR domain-containing protein [Kordiimonas laminariae]MCK0070551.1 SPOR domain-containing protein [Kordiimonas laminariae]
MNDEEQTGLGGQKDIPPWLQPVPEDEEEQTASVMGSKKLWIATGVGAVVTIALFASVVWYLYDSASSGPAKHVAAPETAFKEKPADVGGMQVAHQDKEVFNQVDGTKPRQSVELGTQPEKPVEELPEDPVGDIAAAVTGDKTPAVVDQPKVEDPTSAPVKEEPKPEVAASETPAQVEEKPVDIMEGKFRIQLGAYGSEPSAKRAWVGIRGKFYEYLKEKSSIYESVDTGGRTLYRLRVGPFDNRAEADQTCLALRAGQQACIVVTP